MDAEIEGITFTGLGIKLLTKPIILFSRIILIEEYSAGLINSVRKHPNSLIAYALLQISYYYNPLTFKSLSAYL